MKTFAIAAAALAILAASNGARAADGDITVENDDGTVTIEQHVTKNYYLNSDGDEVELEEPVRQRPRQRPRARPRPIPMYHAPQYANSCQFGYPGQFGFAMRPLFYGEQVLVGQYCNITPTYVGIGTVN